MLCLLQVLEWFCSCNGAEIVDPATQKSKQCTLQVIRVKVLLHQKLNHYKLQSQKTEAGKFCLLYCRLLWTIAGKSMHMDCSWVGTVLILNSFIRHVTSYAKNAMQVSLAVDFILQKYTALVHFCSISLPLPIAINRHFNKNPVCILETW